ncbi:hypothetical protein TNCV_2218021 [Trichonephila clavipes]|nr:hypothetical protein TNCV_2218021 [Trichonephila clavipes]
MVTFQILANSVFNSVGFVGSQCWPFTPSSKTSQIYSIGFKSELLGGQIMTEKSEECSSNQPVANRGLWEVQLSRWKTPLQCE